MYQSLGLYSCKINTLEKRSKDEHQIGVEGQSTNPKVRMQIFIKSINMQVWKVIENRPTCPRRRQTEKRHPKQ